MRLLFHVTIILCVIKTTKEMQVRILRRLFMAEEAKKPENRTDRV